jgi:hypothetical protein
VPSSGADPTDVIVPAFQAAPLPANPAAFEKLGAKSASLDLRHRSL